MGIKYENLKVPAMVLKFVEEKASKAALVANTTIRAESKKRKATGAPKATTKRGRAARISKAASAGSNESVAENTPVDAEDA